MMSNIMDPTKMQPKNLVPFRILIQMGSVLVGKSCIMGNKLLVLLLQIHQSDFDNKLPVAKGSSNKG